MRIRASALVLQTSLSLGVSPTYLWESVWGKTINNIFLSNIHNPHYTLCSMDACFTQTSYVLVVQRKQQRRQRCSYMLGKVGGNKQKLSHLKWSDSSVHTYILDLAMFTINDQIICFIYVHVCLENYVLLAVFCSSQMDRFNLL